MNIRQLKSYDVPRYPTQSESQRDATLLERMPRRWTASQPFAALLGAGLLAKAMLAQAEEKETVKPAQAEAVQKPLAAGQREEAEAVRQTRRIATLVAPMLDEALAHDGRGSFGCIAVDPPCFLSENEALELIQDELEKAGLNLQDGMAVDNLEAPLPTGDEERKNSRGEDGVKLGRTRYTFDLGDAKRAVFVEYVSRNDYGRWAGPNRSTAQRFDFPEVMGKIQASFQKRTEGEPVVLGLFFDPLAKFGYERLDVAGLDEQQARLANAQQDAAQKRSWVGVRDKAKAKLRKQVLHFVAFLRQEAILPKE